MNFLAQLLSGGNAVQSIGQLIDDSFLSKEEKLEMEIEQRKAELQYNLENTKILVEQNKAQAEVNKAEASTGNMFIAGWRPAIGWVGALALFYQFLLYPMLLWLPIETPPAPLDYTMLYSLITGMLGIAGLRTYDKAKGINTRKIS